MSIEFNPVNTWLRYGVSDLYFGHANQSNDVFRYGTFFFIMAAEKHLKAVLIENNRNKYQDLGDLNDKRKAVEKIAKQYSHKFDKMINEVSAIYQQELGKEFVSSKIYGYDKDIVIESMSKGYMETRYPVVAPTSRQYQFRNVKGSYYDPLGSSFFTDFIDRICQKCWGLLVNKGIDHQAILSFIEEQYANSRDYNTFKNEYLSKL